MPAETPCSATKLHDEFVIVGTHASGTRAVQHVALLAKSGVVTGPVSVIEMQPPALLGPAYGSMEPQIVAWLQLSPDQTAGIRRALVKLRTTQGVSRIARMEQYVAVPSYVEERDENGQVITQRYSCAGLVAYLYALVGVPLVNEEELPQITEPDLLVAWPNLATFPRPTRERIGLAQGTGPWRVLLPGYLIHALAQATDRRPWTLPFVPGTPERDF